jgi:hypothetical protein
MATDSECSEVALKHAKEAYTEDFSTRFGTRPVKELRPHRLCFFNNNPYKQEPTLADKHRKEFLRRLAEIGIADLAFAEYPDRGPEEGYSYSIILDTPPNTASKVMEIWQDVFVHFGWNKN